MSVHFYRDGLREPKNSTSDLTMGYNLNVFYTFRSYGDNRKNIEIQKQNSDLSDTHTKIITKNLIITLN